MNEILTANEIFVGVTLSLRGNSIPTDGSGRIVIIDINPDGDNNEDALICQSEMPTSVIGEWYLHYTQQTTETSDRVHSFDQRGWLRNRAIVPISASETGQLVRLRRDDSAAIGGRALEGVFTCDIPGDTNTPVSVGIYYPSELHFTYIYILSAAYDLPKVARNVQLHRTAFASTAARSLYHLQQHVVYTIYSST